MSIFGMSSSCIVARPRMRGLRRKRGRIDLRHSRSGAEDRRGAREPRLIGNDNLTAHNIGIVDDRVDAFALDPNWERELTPETAAPGGTCPYSPDINGACQDYVSASLA